MHLEICQGILLFSLMEHQLLFLFNFFVISVFVCGFRSSFWLLVTVVFFVAGLLVFLFGFPLPIVAFHYSLLFPHHPWPFRVICFSFPLLSSASQLFTPTPHLLYFSASQASHSAISLSLIHFSFLSPLLTSHSFTLALSSASHSFTSASHSRSQLLIISRCPAGEP